MQEMWTYSCNLWNKREIYYHMGTYNMAIWPMHESSWGKMNFLLVSYYFSANY